MAHNVIRVYVRWRLEEQNLNEPQNPQLDIPVISGSVFTIDDMKKAFNAGARNGSRAGMRVARGGELNMEHFDDWFPKHYR